MTRVLFVDDEAPLLDGLRTEQARIGGLLHDIGYSVLAHTCPGDLLSAINTAEAERIPLHEAEVRTIGASHAHIGAYLLGLWGLPAAVVDTTAHHHAPLGKSKSAYGPLAAVALAQALLPTDETKAFGADLMTDPELDASVLSSLSAPFDLDEARRRLSGTLKSPETLL